MKLLIVTQKIDINDPILGFFHRWVEEFSKKSEKLSVICLEKGEYRLPANVTVFSLGKENNIKSSILNFKLFKNIKYIFKFYKYICRERKNYDTVFVHMNQEYVLLGWKLWWIFNKKIWFWRNHPKGSILTDLSVCMSDRIFCTSKYSYTAKFRKTEIMPVGIDTELFKRKPEIKKIENSILFLGRIAPIKNVDLLVEAFNILNKEKFDFNAVIVGDATDENLGYFESVKSKVVEYGLGLNIDFRKAVPPRETVDLYNGSELFINLTPTGSMDKTIFEAMACETLIMTSNQTFNGSFNDIFIVPENDATKISERIKKLLSLTGAKSMFCKEFRKYVINNHSLEKLTEKLFHS